MTKVKQSQDQKEHLCLSHHITSAGVNSVSGLLLLAYTLILGALTACVAPPTPPKVPEELQVPGVLCGKGEFAKQEFGRYPELGPITDIRYGSLDHSGHGQLAIVGAAGAIFLGQDQSTLRTVHFAASALIYRVVLVEPSEGGVPVFFDRGGVWPGKVRVFDEKGTQGWEYGSFFEGIDGGAAGDLHGDGKLEVAIGMNGGGGIRLFDARGHQLWTEPAANVWHVEIISASEGKPGEIVHSNADGALTFRDPAGDVLLRTRPTKYVSSFGLARWGKEDQPRHILVPDTDSLLLLDRSGHQMAQLAAPVLTVHATDTILGTPVCFSAKRCYFATLVAYSIWHRSALYLDDPAGKLAYREVLEPSCEGMGVVPSGSDDGGESLLVGCGSLVWKYSAARVESGGRSPG